MIFGNGSHLERNAQTNPNDSMHTSGLRLAGSIALLGWIAGIILMSVVDYSPIPRFVMIFLVLIVGPVAGLSVRWWLFGMVERKAARRKAEMQNLHEAVQAKKIEEAKASGAFDRWKKED